MKKKLELYTTLEQNTTSHVLWAEVSLRKDDLVITRKDDLVPENIALSLIELALAFPICNGIQISSGPGWSLVLIVEGC